MSENIIIKSNIKNIAEEYNISSDFPPALNEKVKEIITQAVKRAEANGRKTIMAKDL